MITGDNQFSACSVARKIDMVQSDVEIIICKLEDYHIKFEKLLQKDEKNNDKKLLISNNFQLSCNINDFFDHWQTIK